MPLDKAVPVHAGDVVSIGAFADKVRTMKARTEALRGRDDSAKAGMRMDANQPAFAPKLRTRLAAELDHFR